jgi:hypothetical protein
MDVIKSTISRISIIETNNVLSKYKDLLGNDKPKKEYINDKGKKIKCKAYATDRCYKCGLKRMCFRV